MIDPNYLIFFYRFYLL